MSMTLDGTSGATFPDSSVQAVANRLTLGSVVPTTSGTTVDITGIPTWAKRVTVVLSGVSLSAAANVILRVGAGSISSTGYNGTYSSMGGASIASALLSSLGTTGVLLDLSGAAARTRSGIVTLVHIGSNLWAFSSAVSTTDANGQVVTSGSIQLGGSLDRVQLLNSSTDTFDAGSVNILYEG